MSGAALFTIGYGPFGEPGKVHTGRFGYTGQVRLPEGGLYHYKARAYSPKLGRFLQTDPIGTADNQNLYAYVGNDPVNWVDPFGLQASPATPLPGLPPSFSDILPGGQRVTFFVDWGNAPAPSTLPWWSDVAGASALNFTAGFTGTLTFGLSDYAFEYAGVEIDTNSTAYTAGEVTGVVATAATGVGASLAIGRAGIKAGLTAARRGLGREATGIAAKRASTWTLGAGKSGSKWAGQMERPGWTPAQIDEAMASGKRFSAPNNLNSANGATRFVHPQTGRSVVIDNKTGQVIHVGGDGFKY